MAVDKRERGAIGTEFVGGVIMRPALSGEILGDDYLRDWTVATVDQMLRSDGTVAAIWRAIVLSITSADWELVPASNSQDDRAIADFVGANLWPQWEDYLRQALLYLPYGFMLFEVVYEVRDGQVWWKKLAPRMPWTVTRWIVRGGQLVEVEQYARDMETQNFRAFRIPAEKLLRFTNDQEGLNFEGKSILRAAYKHWKIKDTLYKIGAIKQERWGVGIPVGTLPPTATPEDEAKFVEILGALRSHEAAYIYLPKGAPIDQCVRILTPERAEGSQDLMEQIRHHDVMIARSVLAEFIALGETNYGSRAVSADQAELFYMALQGVADYVSHVTTWGRPGENRGIADLVRLNFGDEAGVPTLRCMGLRRRDVLEVAQALSRLVYSGVISPTAEVERYARSLVGAPEPLAPETPMEAQAGQATEGVAEKVQAREPRLKRPLLPSGGRGTVRCTHRLAGGQIKAPGSGRLWREPFPWEAHVPFSEYLTTQDTWERRFLRAWHSFLDRQLRAVQEELGPTLSREELSRLSGLEFPTGGLAADIHALMRQARAHGARSVFQELLVQAGRRPAAFRRAFQELPGPDEADELLRRWAEQSARNLAEKARRALEYFAMSKLFHEEEVPLSEVADELLDMSDKEAILESYICLRPAWELGRNEAGDAFSDLVEYGYYSAILDENVCEVCEEEDGREVMPGEIATPNPDCEGGPRCRCITIWVLRGEVRPEDVASRWYEAFGEE